MSNRYQTLTISSGTVTPGSTAHVATVVGPASFNIMSIAITQDVGGGTYSFRIYKNGTYASGTRLMRVENQSGPFYQPLDRTNNSQGQEGFPIPYDDQVDGVQSGTGNIYTEFVNQDSANHVYTVTIVYEEVPVFDASGNATIRGLQFNLGPSAVINAEGVSLTLAVAGNVSTGWQITAAGAWQPLSANGVLGQYPTNLINGAFNLVTVGVATNAPALGFYTGQSSFSNTGYATWMNDVAGTSALPLIVGRRSRGTMASRSDVQNNDIALTVRAVMYSNGTAFNTAEMRFVTDGSFTTGQAPPSRFEWWNNIAGGSQVNNMTLFSSGNLSLNGTFTTGANSASTGQINLPNSGAIVGRNTANSADRQLLVITNVDVVQLGNSSIVTALYGSDIQFAKPLVALGGGSTATLGTIGGTGPSTAAQNSWQRWLDNNGAAFWVAAWK